MYHHVCHTSIEKISIHLLSKILSFCNEVDGTCTLITCRKLYRHLTVFRIDDTCSLFLNGNGNDPMLTQELMVGRLNSKDNKFRHCFREITVTDPLALLYRLNTRRAYVRKKLHLDELQLNSKEMIPLHLQSLSFKYKAKGKTKFPVLLASYPRCGNSLLRTLIEKVSGVVTGSDTRADRTLSKALSHQHNLVGEGVVSSDLIDLVKTHWPERRGWTAFKAQKIILLVRNPWDAMDSYFNMMLTNTHTKTLSDDVYQKYAVFYEELVLAEIDTWARFYRGYLKLARAEQLSLLLIRYEDLLEDKVGEMTKIIQFIYPDDDLDLPLQKLNDENNVSRQGSYKPRGSKRVGKSFRRYSSEIVKVIESIGNPLLSRLGYGMDNMTNNAGDWETDLQMKYANGNQNSIFNVNIGKELRANDKFGRDLTSWRKNQTKDDQEPLQTTCI